MSTLRDEPSTLCKGCRHGCLICYGLLMRMPTHAITESTDLRDQQICRRLKRRHRARGGFCLRPVDIDYNDLRESAKSCQDCDFILDIVDHFFLRTNTLGYGGIGPDFVLYFEADDPLVISPRKAEGPDIMVSLREDEPQPLLYLGRGPSTFQDPLDPSLTTRIKSWLRTCRDTHSRCSAWWDTLPEMPTRLIEIGYDSIQHARLVTVERPVQYAALSHLWGCHQPLATTKESVAARMRGIDTDEMPQTYRDAILVCQSLDIRYIWIDSLCIIQDDELDWQRESSRMGSVYGSCSVTIASDAASDSSTGFLFPRDHQHLQYTDDDGQRVAVYAKRLPAHPTPDNRHNPPLLCRAWVYQERLLSARVLHFTDSEVQFECNTCCDCECGQYKLARRPRSVKHMFMDSSEIQLSDRSLPAAVEQWFRIVETFTTMELTFDKDRLPAISGIAESLEGAEMGTYMAGLWLTYLPYFLLWTHAMNPAGRLYRRPTSYIAPTWSWASVCGSISWHHVRGKEWEDDERTPVNIFDANFTLKGIDPHGEISAAHLTLRGEFCQALVINTWEANLSTFYPDDDDILDSDEDAPPPPTTAREDSKPPGMNYSWDLDIRGGGELYLDLPDGDETFAGCLVYLMNISTNNAGEKRKSLVLREAEASKSFRRIGLFSHWGWDKLTSPEANWVIKEVTII